jgi:hypothetical protein
MMARVSVVHRIRSLRIAALLMMVMVVMMLWLVAVVVVVVFVSHVYIAPTYARKFFYYEY